MEDDERQDGNFDALRMAEDGLYATDVLQDSLRRMAAEHDEYARWLAGLDAEKLKMGLVVCVLDRADSLKALAGMMPSSVDSKEYMAGKLAIAGADFYLSDLANFRGFFSVVDAAGKLAVAKQR